MEPVGSREIITNVERHQDVDLPVDGGFKDALIIGIREHGTPLKMRDNRPQDRRQFVKDQRHVMAVETCGGQVLRTEQDGLVFEEQRGAGRPFDGALTE